MDWYPQTLFPAEQACRRRFALLKNHTPFCKQDRSVKNCSYLVVCYFYSILSDKYLSTYVHMYLRTYIPYDLYTLSILYSIYRTYCTYRSICTYWTVPYMGNRRVHERPQRP